MIVPGILTRAFEQIFVGVWSTNWPLIVLPLFAYFCAERLSLKLNRLSYRCKQKHTLAVLLTILPGLVFLSLGAYAVSRLRHAEIDSALCVMVFVVPIIIFAVGLANATVSLKKRLQLVRRLLAVTKESDPALRELSEQWQMTIRVLPIEEYACMTVGVLRPIVILSSGAIERLSAQELRAVLLHEQVHVKRKDTLWATLSRFVSDCSFRCSPQAEEIARRTREITADQEASRNIDPRVLASVLVKFARHAPSISYAFAESFASPATISERVERLVDGGSDLHEGQSTSKIMIQVGLASTLILYPYIVRLIAALWLHC